MIPYSSDVSRWIACLLHHCCHLVQVPLSPSPSSLASNGSFHRCEGVRYLVLSDPYQPYQGVTASQTLQLGLC